MKDLHLDPAVFASPDASEMVQAEGLDRFGFLGLPTWLSDQSGRVLGCNEALRAYLGVTATEAGAALLQAIHPDERDAALEGRLERLRLRGGSGLYRWHQVQVQALSGVQHPSGYRAHLCTDIQALIEALEHTRTTLERQQRALETLAETVPGVVYLQDRDSRYLALNAQWEAVIGLPRAQVLGRLPQEIHAVEQAQEFERSNRPVLEQGHALVVEETVWRGEVLSTYASHKAPIRDRDGEVIGLVGVSLDLTAHRDAERAQRQSEEGLRLALEGGHLGRWEWHPGSGTVTLDARTLEMFGLPAHCTDAGQVFGALHPQDLGRVQRALERAVQHGVPYDEEFRVQLEGGQVRWLAGRGQRFGEGTQLRLVGINLDITERREAQVQLEQAAGLLRETNAVQARFVSDAAHELRAPLTAIQGNLELVRRYPQMDPQDRQDALEDAERESARLGRLIGDLLAVARSDTSHPQVFDGLDWGALLLEVAAEARHLPGGARLEWTELPGVRVEGNADRLRQVALQLLENALRYTPPEGRVGLSLRQEADWAELCVWDQGIGIAPEDLPHIFERFYRTDQARNKDSGGSGLGLSIARDIVHKHGGRIWCESEPGVGSRFFIRLPLER